MFEGFATRENALGDAIRKGRKTLGEARQCNQLMCRERTQLMEKIALIFTGVHAAGGPREDCGDIPPKDDSEVEKKQFGAMRKQQKDDVTSVLLTGRPLGVGERLSVDLMACQLEGFVKRRLCSNSKKDLIRMDA